MNRKQTLYNNWVIDFRKILFCIAVIALGTLYNVKEPNALAIAVIVQGASNIDNFWDCLTDKYVYKLLKFLSALQILFSVLAAVFAIYCLGRDKDYFDAGKGQQAWICIALVVFAVAFAIFPLITDMILNIMKEEITTTLEGEDDEL